MGIVCRQRCMHMGSLARGKAVGRECMTYFTHIEKATLRPVSDSTLCRMCRIPRFRNRRTGAHRPHDRVDDVICCILQLSDEEVDATVDCVPVASSRVTRVGFGAWTKHVGQTRNVSRALAGLLVVEVMKGRQASASGRGQRKCCKCNRMEASSAKCGLWHTPSHTRVSAEYSRRCAIMLALCRCARMHVHRHV
jgi:hypothetical protein